MTLLDFLYKNGLWISWPLCGLGVFLIWLSIATVIRVVENHRICSLPLIARQEVDFAEAGRVILWLEAPNLSGRFSGLKFELHTGGVTLDSRMALFRRGSSSFSKSRIADRVFTIPHPGRYVLETKGLGPARAGDEKHRLIFMRPYLLSTVGCILGILFGAFLAIGSIVNFSIRYFQGSG